AQLASGYYHSCAIDTDGRLTCWGSNDEGELGRGTRALSPVPVPVGLGATVDDFAIGRYTGCARAGGKLSCWGRDNEGELGDGTTISTATPIPVATGLAVIEGVSTGAWHTCAWGGGTARC